MRLVTDAAQPSLALPKAPPASGHPLPAECLASAATALLAVLERGQALDARTLREAMTAAFGASDNEGGWVWKDAYEACEAALLLFLRRHFAGMRARAGSNSRMLDMLGRLAALTPTHTRRSEESQQLQQFSTPVELGFIASFAAGITPADLVLEPSAGTGQLAIFAEAHGAALALNEIAPTRADLLSVLFPGAAVTRFNAEQIHDYLPAPIRPTVILMNPPFSVAPHVEDVMPGTDLRHLRSALQRLAPGGRLAAITRINAAPSHPDVRDALQGLDARVVFTAGIAGTLFRRHGTTVETRLTIIDRVPGPDGCAHLPCLPMAETARELLGLVTAHVPPRPVCEPLLPSALPTMNSQCSPPARLIRTRAPAPAPPACTSQDEPAIELVYSIEDEAGDAPGILAGDTIYEPYRVETIRIEGARPHPTKLVQSAAMASVKPPKPSYRPHLPARVMTEGLLSDAQLESVVFAGEALARHLGRHAQPPGQGRGALRLRIQ